MAGWKGLQKMLDNNTMLRVACADCVGKTVAGVARAGTTGPLLFKFTDDTYLQLSIEDGPGSDDVELTDSEPFHRVDYYPEDMVALGILTEQSLREERQRREAEERKIAEQREREERAEYARLQRKYGKSVDSA